MFKGKKSKLKWVILFTVFSLFIFQAIAIAGHGDERPAKKGVLLVAFGTSVPEAQAVFKNVEEKVKATFPGVPVRWAFTSKIIRDKLAKEGQQLDSVAEAMAKMQDEDFTDVAVQSLHTIPGAEYDDTVAIVKAFEGLPGGIRHISIGCPLLSSTEDMMASVDAMMANFPKERKPDEAVVLMGHGTHHPGNAYYPAIQYFFWKKDKNVFVGTVEGSPELDDVMAELKARGIKKVYLMPFMAVAGDHAMNDMAGDEPDSWKSVLTKAGFECQAVLQGTAGYDQIVAIWIEHLKRAMSHT